MRLLTFRDALIGCALIIILAFAGLPATGHAAAVTVADSSSFSLRVSEFTLLGRSDNSAPPTNSVFRLTVMQPALPVRLGTVPGSWMQLLERWASSAAGPELAVRPDAPLQTVFDYYGLRFDQRFTPLRLTNPGTPPVTAPSLDASVVPVPAALWLFASAAGLLAWRARRTVNPP